MRNIGILIMNWSSVLGWCRGVERIDHRRHV